jgi:hypothetical protein
MAEHVWTGLDYEVVVCADVVVRSEAFREVEEANSYSVEPHCPSVLMERQHYLIYGMLHATFTSRWPT